MAALERARDQDLAVYPGQDIEYIAVDDEKSSRDHVALAHEEIETYDASYYETQLVRAVESVLSPLDWDGRNGVLANPVIPSTLCPDAVMRCVCLGIGDRNSVLNNVIAVTGKANTDVVIHQAIPLHYHRI